MSSSPKRIKPSASSQSSDVSLSSSSFSFCSSPALEERSSPFSRRDPAQGTYTTASSYESSRINSNPRSKRYRLSISEEDGERKENKASNLNETFTVDLGKSGGAASKHQRSSISKPFTSPLKPGKKIKAPLNVTFTISHCDDDDEELEYVDSSDE